MLQACIGHAVGMLWARSGHVFDTFFGTPQTCPGHGLGILCARFGDVFVTLWARLRFGHALGMLWTSALGTRFGHADFLWFAADYDPQPTRPSHPRSCSQGLLGVSWTSLLFIDR